MKFKIEIDCDNAAFGDDELMFEIARTLHDTANSVEDFNCGVDCPISLRDVNGNTVGRAWFEVPKSRYTSTESE